MFNKSGDPFTIEMTFRYYLSRLPLVGLAVLLLGYGNAHSEPADKPTNTALPVPQFAPRDLVGWWKFDEGQGTSVADASGNGNTATIQNGGWGSGKIAGALHMDGGNDSIVVIPLSDSLRSTANQITVMGWAYRTAEHNVDILGHGYPAVFLGFHGPRFKWQIADARGKLGSCYADPAYRALLETWLHVAGTYDGSTVRLYANGLEICNTPFVGAINMPETAFTMSGYIDRKGNIVDEISGRLDDVRIYNRALSAREILEIYQTDD
jgi:hypothetical protein